jgi:hypothetical protein
MSREYCVSGIDQTVGATTLLFVNPGLDASIEILRVWVNQSENATSAQQQVQFVSQVGSTFPTVTLGATPVALKRGDPASTIEAATPTTECTAGEAGIDASGEGSGAKTIIMSQSFNVVSGFLWLPTPAETIVFPASFASGFGVYFPVAPATTDGWSFGCIYREW